MRQGCSPSRDVVYTIVNTKVEGVGVGTPLTGVRVIEVAEYGFVPSCGAVLADWGADVIKVERPSGDPLRAHAKAGLTAGTPDFDVVIEQFNRNKRDIAID